MAGPAMSARYDDLWAEAYGEMQDAGPAHRHMRRLVSRVLAGLEYGSVVDVGCGAGHNLPLLCGGRSLGRVTGVDVSERALERARTAWPSAEYVRHDVTAGPLDGRWDLVFSSLLLEHVQEDEAVLRHLRAMSAGHVLVTTIAGDWERYRRYDERLGHVRNYARGELEAKLQAAGLTVRDATYWGWPFYSPVARRLQNRSEPSAEWTAATRLLAKALYGLYFLNSRRRGDLVIVLASPA